MSWTDRYLGNPAADAGTKWFETDYKVPYVVFQALLFGRSIVLLLVIIGFEVGVRRHPFILPLLYRSLKVSSKSLRVLDVQISGEIPGSVQKILSCFLWIIRAALAIVVCFLWDRLIAPNLKYDLRRAAHWNRISLDCATGWRCYALKEPDGLTDPEGLATRDASNINEFIRVSVIWDLVEICPFFSSTLMTGPTDLPDRDTRSSRDSAVTCWKIFDVEFTDLVISWGAAGAIFALLLLLFEAFVALLVRHSRRRFHCGHVFDILIGISVCLWVALLVWESMTSISCWVSRLTFLCVPILLLNARRLSSLLKLEMQYANDMRSERLQESNFGSALDKIVGA